MKHLYFAYGSNLSPTQMAMRCTVNPSRSAHPVAIACLTRWRWLICEVGYANVIPPAELCVGKQRTAAGAGKDDDGVFGVLYEMDAADEEILDGYEGVDTCSAGSGSGSGAPREVLRPREQGDGCYNKWFVRAKVVTWLDGGYRVRNGLPGEGGEVKVLVYVDEERVEMGSPKDEYVPRMNRAIREAVELGFPGDWAEEVMRPFIPLN